MTEPKFQKTPPTSDEATLTRFLRREGTINVAWRKTQDTQAPASLDAPVLAAAAAAAQADARQRTTTRPRSNRWRLPIGLAATLVLVFGAVQMQLRERGLPSAQVVDSAQQAESQTEPKPGLQPAKPDVRSTKAAAAAGTVAVEASKPGVPLPATKSLPRDVRAPVERAKEAPSQPFEAREPSPPPPAVALPSTPARNAATVEGPPAASAAPAASAPAAPAPAAAGMAVARAAAEADRSEAGSAASPPPPSSFADAADVVKDERDEQLDRRVITTRVWRDWVARHLIRERMEQSLGPPDRAAPAGRRSLRYAHADPRGPVTLYLDSQGALTGVVLDLQPALGLQRVSAMEHLQGDPAQVRQPDAAACTAGAVPSPSEAGRGDSRYPLLLVHPRTGVDLLLNSPDTVQQIRYGMPPC